MFVRVSLAVLGLVHLLNGIYMLVAPAAWYTSVPGVTATGPFNHHFITDIGFAFAASGVGMIAGFRTGPSGGRVRVCRCNVADIARAVSSAGNGSLTDYLPRWVR